MRVLTLIGPPRLDPGMVTCKLANCRRHFSHATPMSTIFVRSLSVNGWWDSGAGR